VKDLGWRGTGVTLADASGGIAVDPALLDDPKAFSLLDGDVSQPPETWGRSAAYQQARASLAHDDGDDVSAVGQQYFFVNGGAVLDHGQRQRGDCAVAASHPMHCILPWFSLLVPQLRVALNHVAPGGAVMAVYGAPQCASFYILLRCMEDAFGMDFTTAAAPSTSSSGVVDVQRRPSSVHILETMHLVKPPVYVLWTGVCVGGNDTRRAMAQQRLFDALSPTHPLISPYGVAAPCPPASCPSSVALLHAKQLFWLGESDDGFRLAMEGFERYRHLIEPIWGRIEAFLMSRRERAEREESTTSPSLSPSAPASRCPGSASAKRNRGE